MNYILWHDPLLTRLASCFQVNAQDDEDHHVPSAQSPLTPQSPPPSFHSRASSIAPRNRQVSDLTLADAFDADESDLDDEPDDRQRLVRQNSDPITPGGSQGTLSSATSGSSSTSPHAAASNPSAAAAAAAAAANSNNRLFGSGIQRDGVFSNLTAKPERAGTEKEEQPPVCID